MADISITLPDGTSRTLDEGATGSDLAASIGPRLAKDAVVVEVDGEAADLAAPLHDGDVVRILTDQGSRFAPPPAPLDGARARSGRARAVAGGDLRRRTGHRGRVLLRLRVAGRRHVHRRGSRANRREDARDHRGRPAVRALRALGRRRQGTDGGPPVQAGVHGPGLLGRRCGRRGDGWILDQLLPQHA